METHTKSDDRTTWKHWAIALAFLAFVAIGVPAIVSLPMPVSLIVTAALASVIVGATLALGRRAR